MMPSSNDPTPAQVSAWEDQQTAADQTPATDSERAERLRAIQDRVDHHSPEEFGSETVGWLLALLAEQAAAVAKVRDMACDGGCNYYGGPEETCSLHGRPVAEVWAIVVTLQRRLDEQAATIEGVAALVRDAHRQDDGGACLGCGTDWQGSPSASWPCETIAALGSQRTEGQG